MPLVESVELELDRPRKFRMTMWAAMRLHEETGLEIPEFMEILSDPEKHWSNLRAIGGWLWAGFLEDDEALTIDFVMKNLPLAPTELLQASVAAYQTMSEEVEDIDSKDPLEGNENNKIPTGTSGVEVGHLDE